MDWTKIFEAQNLCTLCRHYDNCTKAPDQHYDCWEEKEGEMNNKYLGFFNPDPEFETAYDAWIEYYYRTEVFDRRVCSGISEKGSATPLTGHEASLCNKNALEVRKQIALKITGIDEETSLRARNIAVQKIDNFEVLEREYKRIKEKESEPPALKY